MIYLDEFYIEKLENFIMFIYNECKYKKIDVVWKYSFSIKIIIIIEY